MGIIRQGKRKKHSSNYRSPQSNLLPLSVDQMEIIINSTDRVLYFKRLKYYGCPRIQTTKGGKIFSVKDSELKNMNRDGIIRDIYKVLSETDRTEYIYGIFSGITSFFKWCDEFEMDVNFEDETLIAFGEYLSKSVSLKKIKNGTAGNRRDALAFVLKGLGMTYKTRLLPAFGDNVDKKPHSSLTENELKQIGTVLFYAYRKYTTAYLAGEKPKMCPFYEYAIDKGDYIVGSSRELTLKEAKHKTSGLADNYWINRMIACAAAITFMLTGLNGTPLYNVRRKDVTFKKGSGDNYVIGSLKARANYRDQTNDIGFTKRAKEFMETWLMVSHQLAPQPSDLMFPYFKRTGEVIAFGMSGNSTPLTLLKSQLQRIGCIDPTASQFRKTRSNILMRVVNDVIMVAHANNQTVETAQKDYLHGIEEAHQISLAGAFMAQAEMAKGVDKKKAIEDVYKFKDPMSDFDYKKLKKGKEPNKTLTGVRCEEPLGLRAKKSLKKYNNLNLESNQDICIDFLDCFECDSHVLIAETDDIWLMLSFRDSIDESLARPSLNSTPSSKLSKVISTVESILKRFEEVAPDNYKTAVENNKISPHPLYTDEDSIYDLLGVYS
ncbi:hypothetical protein ACEV8G_01310 [Vibrio parahaemolyticus]|nr:hypothetical protein [Vibrio parahaemolyticus]HCH1486037.1 hypothetical protein [Vibrio parahaemolyticus]